MRNILLATAIILPSICMAQQPKEIADLRTSYEAAIIRAKEPVTNRYVEELERLKSTFTRSANLQAALSADEEIKRVKAELLPQGAASGSPMPGAAEVKVRPSSKGPITIEWLVTTVLTRSDRLYWFESPNTMFTQMKDDQKQGLLPGKYEFVITSADTIEFTTALDSLTFTFDRQRKTAAYASKSKGGIDVAEVSEHKK